LKKKVSEPIAKALSTLDTPPSRNDFTAWAAKCQTFYDNQQEYEHNHQSRNIPRQQANAPPAPVQPRLPSGDDAMDLDALNKMKAEERQYCYTNGLCFYCKAPGHDVENCEKKKTADARRALGQGDRGRPGPRGRGGFAGRNPFNHANMNRLPPFPQQRPQTSAPNRIRFIDSGGFVEGEVESTTSLSPSESASQTINQEKEQPLS
jgi:hypothetical protein